MTRLSELHRIARAALIATARRWPEDLSETMAYEWGAELDAIRHDPRTGRTLRAYRMIAFAGSIALATPVEEPGLGLGSAPSWLPLALLPGGTAHFGAYHADGAVAFGSLRGSGPAYYTSEILLGNASAMIGPMLLCSAFVLALALRRSPRPAVAGRQVLRVPLGVAGTVGALIGCELIRRSTDIDGTLHRILDNSTVFGFGFLADTPGRIAVALLGGFLIARIGDDARPHGI
jgi:hypothetical protein